MRYQPYNNIIFLQYIHQSNCSLCISMMISLIFIVKMLQMLGIDLITEFRNQKITFQKKIYIWQNSHKTLISVTHLSICKTSFASAFKSFHNRSIHCMKKKINTCQTEHNAVISFRGKRSRKKLLTFIKIVIQTVHRSFASSPTLLTIVITSVHSPY